MIDAIYRAVTENAVKAAGGVTDSTLKSVKTLLAGSLHLSGEGLELLSKAMIFWEQGRETLIKGKTTLHEHRDNTDKAFNEAIQTASENFSKAIEAVEHSGHIVEKSVFENRVISSILGGSLDDKIKMSRIQFSFRDNEKDITAEQAVELYKNSGLKKSIFWLPGLLTDETMWQNRHITLKERKVLSHGLADRFRRGCFFPYFILYNNGKHIYKNGADLLHLLEEWDKHAPAGEKINLVSYSMGGLVIRSMLHRAKENSSPVLQRMGKVVFIASPDGGSYLEKAGFWLAMALNLSPNAIARFLGVVGNLRSDAIKDLSHGMIREEPWYTGHHIARYFTPRYYDELDGIDFYSVYSTIATNNNPIQSWLGDGIVEEPSLRFLNSTVIDKLPDKQHRVLKLIGENHFSIIHSPKLYDYLRTVFV
ncbi:MAG: hypothetical protein KDK38_03720 [Leptospiraceae bacterium]|nr:hypothetical protein [Leptospiraceae bacterium]